MLGWKRNIIYVLAAMMLSCTVPSTASPDLDQNSFFPLTPVVDTALDTLEVSSLTLTEKKVALVQ